MKLQNNHINCDYSPGGMLLPNRHESTNKYRYGFNGMEKDDEVSGEGNSYDFGARFYNPRVGRWMSTDPLEVKYPYASPYNSVLNNPINSIDPDGRDVILVVWATNSNTGYGHAAVAVSNYKAVQYKFTYNGKEYTSTKMVPDGTYTYYDLWPGNDIDGDGKADEMGNAGPKDAVTGPLAFYQVKDKLGAEKKFNKAQGFNKGTLITEDVLKNGDVSEGEGRAPDGVIKLYSGYVEDMETIADLKAHMASNGSYTSVINNCSDFAACGIAESLDTYKLMIEISSDESYFLSYTTPNGIFKYADIAIKNNPLEGTVLKDPKKLVESTFEEVIIEPKKAQTP